MCSGKTNGGTKVLLPRTAALRPVFSLQSVLAMIQEDIDCVAGDFNGAAVVEMAILMVTASRSRALGTNDHSTRKHVGHNTTPTMLHVFQRACTTSSCKTADVHSNVGCVGAQRDKDNTTDTVTGKHIPDESKQHFGLMVVKCCAAKNVVSPAWHFVFQSWIEMLSQKCTQQERSC